jgi:hypothetical protein
MIDRKVSTVNRRFVSGLQGDYGRMAAGAKGLHKMGLVSPGNLLRQAADNLPGAGDP